jgi:hypothetical protein
MRDRWPARVETDFDEFSACSDAEAVSGGVVCVSVLVAPQGGLRIVHMTNDSHREQRLRRRLEPQLSAFSFFTPSSPPTLRQSLRN